MKEVSIPKVIIVPSNNGLWTDMVANNPQQAIKHVMSGVPKNAMDVNGKRLLETTMDANMGHIPPFTSAQG